MYINIIYVSCLTRKDITYVSTTRITELATDAIPSSIKPTLNPVTKPETQKNIFCHNNQATVAQRSSFQVISFFPSWKRILSKHLSQSHGRRKDFIQGGTKVVKFVFSHSKLRKKVFLLNISKSGTGPEPACPPFRRPCAELSNHS